VRLLLEHEADVTLTDMTGATALTWAAREGHTAVAAEIKRATPTDPPTAPAAPRQKK